MARHVQTSILPLVFPGIYTEKTPLVKVKATTLIALTAQEDEFIALVIYNERYLPLKEHLKERYNCKRLSRKMVGATLKKGKDFALNFAWAAFTGELSEIKYNIKRIKFSEEKGPLWSLNTNEST